MSKTHRSAYENINFGCLLAAEFEEFSLADLQQAAIRVEPDLNICYRRFLAIYLDSALFDQPTSLAL